MTSDVRRAFTRSVDVEGHRPRWPEQGCRRPRTAGILAGDPLSGRPHNERAMAHIRYVPDDEATGLLAELYGSYDSGRGVDHILRIHSLNPRSMRDHHRLYSHLMRGPSPLTRRQREMIAVVVSAQNRCFY